MNLSREALTTNAETDTVDSWGSSLVSKSMWLRHYDAERADRVIMRDGDPHVPPTDVVRRILCSHFTCAMWRDEDNSFSKLLACTDQRTGSQWLARCHTEP